MEICSDKQTSTVEKIKWYDSLWPWVLIIMVTQSIYWGTVIWYFHNTGDVNQNWANAGTFGDLFGGLTCLFSGLAFAGLIVTIRQQSREIKLQLREQENTRKEFEEQNRIQKLQGYQADVYRRIELVKSLEKEVKFYKTNRRVTPSGETINEDQIQLYTGTEAINAMSIALMDIQKVLFAKKNPTAGDLILIDDLANDMFRAYVSLQPLIVNIGDILRDIKRYFVGDSIEMLHHFRLVINVFNIHMKTLICLYKGVDTDAALIDTLIEKGYIPKSTVLESLLHEATREILANLMMKNISATEARDKWKELQCV